MLEEGQTATAGCGVREERTGGANNEDMEDNTKQSRTGRLGGFSRGEGVQRRGGVLRRKRKPLTFVCKRINGNINVAAATAEC